MKWNPSDYDNITKINVPFDLIWTPGKIKNSLKIIKIILICYTTDNIKDTFLWNAADTNSWSQWDTSSKEFLFSSISNEPFIVSVRNVTNVQRRQRF